MKGCTPPIRVGAFPVDHESWFDIRCCDGGVTLSLLDEFLNRRWTVIVDGEEVKFSEVAAIKPEPPKTQKKRKR